MPAAATPPSRLALVIGNATYGGDLGVLRNPVHDASDMATTLQQLGFTVTLLQDATHQQMETAVVAFSRQLRQGGIGLFYFAGHGVQLDGSNYLVPVGVSLASTAGVRFHTVAAEWVLASMEEAGNGLNIMILDACRNNPFPRQWRTTQRGLAPMQAARGSLIAYATAPGATAADGSERNGIYTKHLLRAMTIPDLLIEQMFKQVRVAVEQETQGQQTPWESSSLRGDFMFRPQMDRTAAPASPQTPSPESTPETPAAPPSVADRAAARHQEPALTLTGRDGAPMVLVPTGPFLMGSSATEIDTALQRQSSIRLEQLADERPQHTVTLAAFYIDAYEVTNARFQQFVQATGYRTDAERDNGGAFYVNGQWEPANGGNWRTPQGPGSHLEGLDNHPVVYVTWYDAEAYCQWADKRLPTEAEWEKAARGIDGRVYPWGNTLVGTEVNFCDRRCSHYGRDNTVDDGVRYSAPVGHYSAGQSPYGVYDMAGNVWEWVADGYSTTYYQQSPVENPPGPLENNRVVFRGGSWLSGPVSLRTANRTGEPPTFRDAEIGFRCAKTP
jgi:formylglycine-generating enzyme required for sulfatase activity